jgi:hypothetical protein
MGHLGARVSLLLDGQLPAAEAEKAWEHVHACHACRDLVEREGWIKTSLAGLSFGETTAPDHLKGSLLGGPPSRSADVFHPHVPSYDHPVRRNVGLVAMGGGAVGAAFLGVLALGVAPADSPVDRRPPTTSLTRPTDVPRQGPLLPTGAVRPVRTP